jgi:hypothetical protein
MLHQVTGQEVFIYELDNIPKALEVLQGEWAGCVQAHDAHTLTLAMPRAQLPAVSRLLAAEAGLLGLHTKQNTLEDAVIHITGGGTPLA